VSRRPLEKNLGAEALKKIAAAPAPSPAIWSSPSPPRNKSPARMLPR